jgi:hypothetical protein
VLGAEVEGIDLTKGHAVIGVTQASGRKLKIRQNFVKEQGRWHPCSNAADTG